MEKNSKEINEKDFIAATKFVAKDEIRNFHTVVMKDNHVIG